MALRGSEHASIGDIVAGFLVIGLLCAASFFSFRRLDPAAGSQLNGQKAQTSDEE
jgi:hypothetical protein